MDHQVLRHEALEHCHFLKDSQCAILLIEAQAGQGKTTLITQYEAQVERPFVWTTCTRSDMDPRSFVDKIVANINDVYPGFATPELMAGLGQKFSPGEFVTIAAQLVAAQIAGTALSMTMVFDDTHLLETCEQSKLFIREFTRAATAPLQFVMAGRFPLTLDATPLFSPQEHLFIDSSLLAFSREEIARLYNDIFKIPATGKKVRELYKATEGWAAGLSLLQNAVNITKLNQADSELLGSYFSELLAGSSNAIDLHQLSRLSLLPELHEELLTALTTKQAKAWLDDMADKNLFVRIRKEQGKAVYRLHHLFQDFLGTVAASDIPDEDKDAFLQKAGHHYLASNQIEEGLRCLVQAKAWDMMNAAVQQHGLELLRLNHHQSLLNILDIVPADTRMNAPWLCFAYGAVQLAITPNECAPTLHRAKELFENDNDPAGELTTISLLLNFHILVSGMFGQKGELVRRAVELFTAHRDHLPKELLLTCAQAISLGKAYYESQIDDALIFSNIAKGLHAEFNAEGDHPEIFISETLIRGLMGDIASGMDKLDSLLPVVNNPFVSPTNRFSLQIIQINYSLMHGDFISYDALQDRIKRDWSDILAHSYLGAFLTVWDMDKLLSQGKYSEIIKTADRNSNLTGGPHIESQVQHYKMIALAHLGHEQEMYATMRKALRLRAQAGGPYFIHLTHALTAASLSLVGNTRAAERIFTKCITQFATPKAVYHSAIIFAYRAAMRVKNDQQEAALDDIRLMLESLSQYGNKHFFGWSPAIMPSLLSLAVKEGIHKKYARMLARQQMALDILDNGTIVPLIQVRMFGTPKLTVDEATLKGTAISPMWQRVLRLLTLAPQQAVDISAIQYELWPESDLKASRSKFDTMLSRFRGKLASKFGKGAARTYLQTRDQKLHLVHSVIDYDMAIQEARKGISLAGHGKLWESHKAFLRMAHHIGPDYLTEVAPAPLPEELTQVLVRALTKWAELLQKVNDPEQALQVVSRTLDSDPTNESLQRHRYDLLASLKRPGEAAKSLREYKKLLAADDFSSEEIDQIIDNLLA